MALDVTQRAQSNGTSVERATIAIQQLIHAGEVVPGQQLRQETLAQRIGMSRAPVREALQALLADGVVEHVPNVGYHVKRLSADELAQIYLMRRLLEQELYMAIEAVPPGMAAELEAINREMRQAIDRRNHGEVMAINTQFHFAIFDLSPLDVVCREVKRLWTLSQPYRAVYVYDDATCRRILTEHDLIVNAVRESDVAGLAKVASKHRLAAERAVAGILTPAPTV